MSNSYDNIYKLIKFTNSKVDYFEGTKKYISTGDSDDIENGQEVTFDNKPSRANVMGSAGDILIAKMANTNKVILLDNDTQNNIYSTGFYCLNSTKLFNKYLFYLLSNDEFNKEKDSWSFGTTQVSLNENGFKRIKINFVSDIIKQMKISKFLDKKVLLLDKILENQQQQIEKLKEYKQSLISFYIDKYIYDLQEHKGRINRDAIPLNYIANIIRGNTPFKKDELLDKGVYVGVQYGKTYKTEIIDENYNFFVDSKFFKEDQIVNNGDVIFISTSETIEDLGHASFYNRNELGLLGGEQFVFKPNKEKTNGKFLYYCAVEFSKYIKKYSTGLKVYRYNLTHLKNIHINLPSIDIQESIVKQLDKNILAINSILGIKQKKIDKLNEYKKSLIYEYVTGKKEVA